MRIRIRKQVSMIVLIVIVIISTLVKDTQCLHIQSIGDTHYSSSNQQHHHKHINYNKDNDNPNSMDIKQSVQSAISLYNNDQQIQHIINQLTLEHSQIIQKYSCQNDENYNYVVIEDKHIDNKNNNNKKKQVVITCNVHARELLTTQVCIEFIQNIITTYYQKQSSKQQQPQTKQQTKQQSLPQSQLNFTSQQIHQLLTQSKLTIFYRGNEQRDNVINRKDYCIRKDSNNIDINRNFPTNFNLLHINKKDQQYPGQSPLTQTFSKCLDNYLKGLIGQNNNKIHTFIDIHTGEFTLFDSFQSEKNITYPILQKVKQIYCPQCRITSLGTQQDDEIANGQIFTDIKKRYSAIHSVLFQIYGGYNSHLSNQLNCIAIFNPLTIKQLNYYKNIWTNALVYFIIESLKIQ